jgi:hypothetical protein
MKTIGERERAVRIYRPEEATIEDAGFLSDFLGEGIGEGPILILYPSGSGGLAFNRYLGGFDQGT